MCNIIFIISGIELDRKKIKCKVSIEEFEICKISTTLFSVEDLISPSRSWHKLIIADSEITDIYPNAFKNLHITSLTLELSNEKLSLNKSSLNGLYNIKSLRFQSRIIELKPNLFESLVSLEDLQLSIDESSAFIGNLFTELPSLKNLTIFNSNLRILKACLFCEFEKPILSLDLTSNNIQNIEINAFLSMKKLLYLKLDSNYLHDLGYGVFNGLRKLKTLIISSNRLRKIPFDVFTELKEIEIIDLHDNKISCIDEYPFSDTDVNTIYLNNNELTFLSSGIFHNTKKLRYITFDNNKISEIKQKTFKELVLDELILSNNKLTSINAGIFDGLSARKIDFSNNFIVNIQRHAFIYLDADYIIFNSDIVNFNQNKSEWGLSDRKIIIT